MLCLDSGLMTYGLLMDHLVIPTPCVFVRDSPGVLTSKEGHVGNNMSLRGRAVRGVLPRRRLTNASQLCRTDLNSIVPS